MSFVTNRLPSRHHGAWTVSILFLLLWLICGLSLLFHTLLLKKQLQEQELSRVENALNIFLQNSSSSSTYHFNLQVSPPEAIDFIRISRDRDQLLITDQQGIPLAGLVDLDPRSHGTWISLTAPDSSGNWILVSRKLNDGSTIQAGKNDLNAGISTYQTALSSSWLIFFLTAFPCLGIAIFLHRQQKKPLQELGAAIRSALQHQRPAFDTFHHGNGELTELYQLLEKTFSQNQQLIAEMQSSLDNVAHDLRTPMTRLRAVAEYALQSDQDDPEIYRNSLSDCLEESERVLSMLGTMMSVAEAEAGTMRLKTETVSIKETLEDVISLYRYVAEEEKISLSLTMEDDSLSILADKTRISQVWANLLDNAIKYGHEGGTVEISTGTEGDMLVTSFCDDGMGISDSEISRIWDRLYRGDRSRSRQGLGLGLNYVKAVVEAHGGKVRVSSTIRKGSCFEVLLPLLPAAVGKAEITDQRRMIREADVGNGEV